jgi:o-succinylbenzoate synthase
LKATYHQHNLIFKTPSGTSRGVLTSKETWFITIEDEDKKGVGECGILRGLSIDDRPDYEEKLLWTCNNIQLGAAALWEQLVEFPSIQFGVEMAFKSLENNNSEILFPSEFTEGKKPIIINGLVWMGTEDFMLAQIKDKIKNGFSCIKLKIGAIDFKKELELIRFIRQNFSSREIEIRLDANGAFDVDTCLEKLIQLSEFEIHSIEQPLPKGSKLYPELCLNSPIAIALDEELIGVFSFSEKEDLLQKIKPRYIILKPSFIGGFKGTKQWIDLAVKNNIKWWITSALESNIGLNALAQWTFLQQNPLPQGLGTGGLFTNNFDCSLQVKNGQLWFHKSI